MSAQADLFGGAPEPPPVQPVVQPPSKREQRAIRRALREIRSAWQSAVEDWAGRQLHDLLLDYAVEAGNELICISVDGSGPPAGWHEYVRSRLADDCVAAGLDPACVRDAGDPALVKTAIRIGRLPRSIIGTMPPKPPEAAAMT